MMKLVNLGWIVAAALVATAITAGFQTQTTKIGVVDMTKVFNDSQFAKTQVETLKGMGQARQDMLGFVDQNRVFTPEQATRFHDLSMKVGPLSAAEKAELEKIKNDVKAADKRLKDLQTKSNPTPAETQEMNDLSRRVQTTTESAQRWSRDAQDELEGMRGKLQKDTLDKVREAVKQVAAAGGYTVVFASELAPYGANDLTAEALKVMDKK